MDQESLPIRPIGHVRSTLADLNTIYDVDQMAVIELDPVYAAGLTGIEANSHLWLLSWFDKADRDRLTTVPYRIDSDLPVYGVFALRSPCRPNPIALSLVALERVEGTSLVVRGLDAVDGTPILDIKPYFESDIVFSPTTPPILPRKRAIRIRTLFKRARQHHREECPALFLAVRMAVWISEHCCHPGDSNLSVSVTGSACLADALQILSNARLANPPRFSYTPETIDRVEWRYQNRLIVMNVIAMPPNREAMYNLPDEALFQCEPNP